MFVILGMIWEYDFARVENKFCRDEYHFQITWENCEMSDMTSEKKFPYFMLFAVLILVFIVLFILVAMKWKSMTSALDITKIVVQPLNYMWFLFVFVFWQVIIVGCFMYLFSLCIMAAWGGAEIVKQDTPNIRGGASKTFEFSVWELFFAGSMLLAMVWFFDILVAFA